jgi:hypothetical protein
LFLVCEMLLACEHRKKRAEGNQVVDGAVSDEDKPHVKAGLQSQNGNPKAAGHLFEYEEGGPWPCSVTILPHLHDVAESLAEYVARISEDSIKHRGSFTIVLSGGSLVKVSLPWKLFFSQILPTWSSLGIC